MKEACFLFCEATRVASSFTAFCVLVYHRTFARLALMKLLMLIFSGLGVFLLGSCASNKKVSNELHPQGARVMDLQSSDKYDWKKDIQVGEDGSITGGKRSQFDRASKNGGYRKEYKTPDYLTKNYDQKEWNGSKNYTTGSYQGTSQARETRQSSRYQGDRAHLVGQQSWLAGKQFDKGSYKTKGAREGRAAHVKTGENAQVANRKKVWAWNPKIYNQDEYREMTVAETRSLLGKD